MVSKFYLYAHGDKSAGLGSVYSEMDLNIDVDCEDREEIRKILTDCFSKIYQSPVEIIFHGEYSGRDF